MEIRAVGRAHAIGIHLRDARAGPHVDVELLQQFRGGGRDALGERRQDARGRLEQRDADVLRGIQVVEAVPRVRARGLADFGGQLDARRAGADDHDVHLRGRAGRRAPIRAHAHGEQPPVEALGVVERVERDRMPRGARHAEVVADAAHADHERVVRQRAARQHFLALRTEHRVERQRAPRAVESADRALPEPEVMPVRDREIVEVVRVGVHPAGRDLVQQRLPDVRGVAVDERHLHAPVAAVAVAELGRERQAARPAADDDDAMLGDGRGRHGRSLCPHPTDNP